LEAEAEPAMPSAQLHAVELDPKPPRSSKPSASAAPT